MMSIIVIALLIVAILIGLVLVSLYNTMRALIDAIEHNKQQIDIQLDRRFNTFQSLIASVQQYMDYERSTLKDVLTLHARSDAARSIGDEKARITAEHEISKIAMHLPIVFEQYPELKAGKHVLQLQEEIINNENKLAYATEAYNDSVNRFLTKKASLIESLLVKFHSEKLNKHYTLWVSKV